MNVFSPPEVHFPLNACSHLPFRGFLPDAAWYALKATGHEEGDPQTNGPGQFALEFQNWFSDTISGRRKRQLQVKGVADDQ